jgi:hypothetical protein
MIQPRRPYSLPRNPSTAERSRTASSAGSVPPANRRWNRLAAAASSTGTYPNASSAWSASRQPRPSKPSSRCRTAAQTDSIEPMPVPVASTNFSSHAGSHDTMSSPRSDGRIRGTGSESRSPAPWDGISKSRPTARCAASSSSRPSDVQTHATLKRLSNPRAEKPGSFNLAFASSQIRAAVFPSSGSPIPKTRCSSSRVHSQSGFPTVLGTVSAHALNRSKGVPARPVINASGTPAMRMARCLYGSCATHSSVRSSNIRSAARSAADRWLW